MGSWRDHRQGVHAGRERGVWRPQPDFSDPKPESSSWGWRDGYRPGTLEQNRSGHTRPLVEPSVKPSVLPLGEEAQGEGGARPGHPALGNLGAQPRPGGTRTKSLSPEGQGPPFLHSKWRGQSRPFEPLDRTLAPAFHERTPRLQGPSTYPGCPCGVRIEPHLSMARTPSGGGLGEAGDPSLWQEGRSRSLGLGQGWGLRGQGARPLSLPSLPLQPPVTFPAPLVTFPAPIPRSLGEGWK